MKYEAFCADYHPHTAAMAVAAAEKANELVAKGYKVLSFVQGMLPGVLAGIGLIALIIAKKEDKD